MFRYCSTGKFRLDSKLLMNFVEKHKKLREFFRNFFCLPQQKQAQEINDSCRDLEKRCIFFINYSIKNKITAMTRKKKKKKVSFYVLRIGSTSPHKSFVPSFLSSFFCCCLEKIQASDLFCAIKKKTGRKVEVFFSSYSLFSIIIRRRKQLKKLSEIGSDF